MVIHAHRVGRARGQVVFILIAKFRRGHQRIQLAVKQARVRPVSNMTRRCGPSATV